MAQRIPGLLILVAALPALACAPASTTREACSACQAASAGARSGGGASGQGAGAAAGERMGGSVAGGGTVAPGADSTSPEAGPAVSDAGAPAGCRAVSGEEARKLVQAGALLIDVRTVVEYEQGHLDGALNVPLAELGARLTELSRERTLVVYCASGGRSAEALRQLCAAGFEVANLGPMSAWPS